MAPVAFQAQVARPAVGAAQAAAAWPERLDEAVQSAPTLAAADWEALLELRDLAAAERVAAQVPLEELPILRVELSPAVVPPILPAAVQWRAVGQPTLLADPP